MTQWTEAVPGMVAFVAAASALVGWTYHVHEQWQESIERERFVLAMKEASTPELLAPNERDRLTLLRTPWWAIWRWLPQLNEGPS